MHVFSGVCVPHLLREHLTEDTNDQQRPVHTSDQSCIHLTPVCSSRCVVLL